MKKTLFVLILLFLTEGRAADRHTAIFAELWGRAGSYSINVDHLFTEDFGAGVGYSYWSLGTSAGGTSTAIIPIFLEYFFLSGNWRPFVTAGYSITTTNNVFTFFGSSTTNSSFATVGGGIEYRSSGGFLLRIAPYLMMGNSSVLWGGLSLGYAF